MEAVRTLTAKGGTADEVRDRIVQGVSQHVGTTPPFDDMCLVVIERTDVPSGPKFAGAETVDEDAIETAI